MSFARRLATVLCLTGIAALAGCGHPPDLIGVDNVQSPAQEVPGAQRHRIFITTTRAPSPQEGVFYSGARSQELGLASVVVTVPPNHVQGKVERARTLPPNPRRQFAVVDPVTYAGEPGFLRALDAELARRAPEDRQILFFVHGYDVTMSDAVLRAGQFVQDSGFEGVPVVFSWASAGRRMRYVYDINSVLAARPMIEQASNILTRTEARGFDVFAHSMGSLLVMEVLVQSELSGTLNSSGKLDNIMLAAPDIDVDVFRSQLGQIRRRQGNIFVLASQDDFALHVSRRISGGVDRVGAADARELEGLGVTVIDLSQIHDSGSGAHRKFAGSPEVVRLIGHMLQKQNYGQPPGPPSVFEVLQGVPVLRDLLP